MKIFTLLRPKFLLLITFIFVVGCPQTPTETVMWDMPTPFPDTVFHTVNIKEFIEDVKRSTAGVLSIHIHPGASLYKHPEIKQAVRSGQVPIGEIVISVLGNENPIFEIDSLPLLATSYEQAHQLWEASATETKRLLEEQGLLVLFVVPWPPQGLYIKKEIHSLKDLSGLKVRVYNSTLSRFVELMAANPTTVQTPEVPQAFSTGVIDAMITSPSTGVSSQVWDYVKYYYDLQTWIPKNVVMVNKKAFNALPANVQEAVLASAAKAEKRGWEMSAKETKEKTQILIDNGIKVMGPSDELKASLIEIRQKMLEEWQNKAGEKGRMILKTYQHNF